MFAEKIQSSTLAELLQQTAFENWIGKSIGLEHPLTKLGISKPSDSNFVFIGFSYMSLEYLKKKNNQESSWDHSMTKNQTPFHNEWALALMVLEAMSNEHVLQVRVRLGWNLAYCYVFDKQYTKIFN